MIQILETKPTSVSGRTSLLVKFQYNPVLVEAVKTVPNGLYLKKEQLWEFPVSSLALLIDTLVRLDDIKLKLIQENDEIKTSPNSHFYSEGDKILRPLPENQNLVPKNESGDTNSSELSEKEITLFKYTPFKHQIEAINFLLSKKKSLLLDSMGVGKSAEIIWYAETLKRRGLIDHCLLVCGVNAVKENFKKEIEKFSTESCRIIGQRITKHGHIKYDTVANRAKEILEPIDEFFVIINIESLGYKPIVEAFKKTKNKFGLIAVDEAHRALANKSAERAGNLIKMKADYKVAATGTLITNNPLSCYGSLAFTENDSSTLTYYKSLYCEFGGFKDSQVIGYHNLDVLRDELEACSIRRTFADITDENFPKKMINPEYIELDEEHAKFYGAIKDGVKEEADKVNLTSSNLLALTTRLRQAAVCPDILTSNKVKPTKIHVCAEKVEEIISTGEKVVVLSNFKQPVYQLAELLKDYNPLICTGDQDADTVSKAVDSFQNDPNSKLVIGTHGRMGTGLTLNAAMYLICLDVPYTYASFAQSCDRIYRVNNTRPAYITVLIANDTIDERVWDIVNKKKDLADYLVDGVDTAISDSLTEELRDIITDL